jgi:nitrate/TMAO reductase-like tetraheme cytochrome c subunit
MSEGEARGWLARQRQRIETLWARPQVRFGTLVGGLGLAAGLVIAAGTTSVIRQTNSTEFCVSCHVYENFYEEFQSSEHYLNATGVQASCASCHLPHDNWASMIAAKAHSGFKDVWAYTLGGIDTPEDFEARRAALARDIWEQYERNDSQFCRHCHEPDAWDLEAQSAMARGAHRGVLEGEATCIACHKGVAHSIPEGALSGGSGNGGEDETTEKPQAPSGGEGDSGGEQGTNEDAGEAGDPEATAPDSKSGSGTQATSTGDGGTGHAGREAQGTPESGGTAERPSREANDAAGDEQRAAQRESGGEDATDADGARTPDTRASTASPSGEEDEAPSPDAQAAEDDAAGGSGGEPEVSPGKAAQLASTCRMCHGASAPALRTFASLSQADFLSALENHMATGGTVESLTTAERRALHHHLRRQ